MWVEFDDWVLRADGSAAGDACARRGDVWGVCMRPLGTLTGMSVVGYRFMGEGGNDRR